jgi:hypothetical protein
VVDGVATFADHLGQFQGVALASQGRQLEEPPLGLVEQGVGRVGAAGGGGGRLVAQEFQGRVGGLLLDEAGVIGRVGPRGRLLVQLVHAGAAAGVVDGLVLDEPVGDAHAVDRPTGLPQGQQRVEQFLVAVAAEVRRADEQGDFVQRPRPAENAAQQGVGGVVPRLRHDNLPSLLSRMAASASGCEEDRACRFLASSSMARIFCKPPLGGWGVFFSSLLFSKGVTCVTAALHFFLRCRRTRSAVSARFFADLEL